MKTFKTLQLKKFGYSSICLRKITFIPSTNTLVKVPVKSSSNHHKEKKEEDHKHHKHSHKSNESNKLTDENWEDYDLPNINTTNTSKPETSNEYENHNHTMSSTRKIYGNMVGMDKVDEYITTCDVSKEFLKDGAKASNRPAKEEYVFRGNLNIDASAPPEKDVTDDNKTIK